MFCSGCGQNIAVGQGLCPSCGRPVPAPIPPVPDLRFQLDSYAGKIKALGIVWLIYGGLSLCLGFIGMTFAQAFVLRHFGPWPHSWAYGPFQPGGFGPFLHMMWVFFSIRVILLFATGYGLLQHARWGRIVAIVSAFLNLLKFPFGTALGIWTLVVLLGYRNSSLYEQLPSDGYQV